MISIIHCFSANGEIRKQKVVCIDSPFIPKMITPQEKNQIYQRLALKALLLHPNHHKACPLETKLDFFARSFKQEGGDSSELMSSENLFSDAADDLSSLEVFGTNAQGLNLNKCVLSADLAMSDDDSDANDSDAADLPAESAITDTAQTDDISPVSGDVRPVSPGVPPLSPILCLDGLVDEKPAGGETEGEEKGECSSGGRRRSLRCQKKSGDDEHRGGQRGSDVTSHLSTPRRSMRIASQSKIPDFELTDSDNDCGLVIDWTSPKGHNLVPKGSSDSTVRSKLPRGDRSMPPEESGDVGDKVICLQSPTKDSSTSETAASDVHLEAMAAAAVNCSAIQLFNEGKPDEIKRRVIESDLQPFGQPGSPKPMEVCKGLEALKVSDAVSASESVAAESCDTLDLRSLSESIFVDCIPKMENVEIDNSVTSVSSQTSFICVADGVFANEGTDGKPVKIRDRGRKRRGSVVDTLTEVKVDAMLVPSATNMPVAKRTRGRTSNAKVPVNKDS